MNNLIMQHEVTAEDVRFLIHYFTESFSFTFVNTKGKWSYWYCLNKSSQSLVSAGSLCACERENTWKKRILKIVCNLLRRSWWRVVSPQRGGQVSWNWGVIYIARCFTSERIHCGRVWVETGKYSACLRTTPLIRGSIVHWAFSISLHWC